MVFRYAAGMFILVMVAVLLAACWDKTEMNELALVSMMGVDTDPGSGKKIVYYQIINPRSGTSPKGVPGSEQAPVFTYEISGSTFGEIRSTIYKLLSRNLFIAHLKVLLVSRQTAQRDLHEIVNFIEMQPNKRSSVPILIVDGSISQAMKTSTPLEDVPANAIESRVKLLSRNSLLVGDHIDVKDVIERMERSDTIVLPLLANLGETNAAESGKRTANIDTNRNNFTIEEGAVIRNYRMVGKLKDEQLVWYHLLNGGRGHHVRRFELDGKAITVEIRPERIRRKVSQESGQPVVRIHLDIALSASTATEFIPKTRDEVEKLESRLNQVMEDEAYTFYEQTRHLGWDLLRIRDLLQKYMPDVPDIDQAAKQAKVRIEMDTRFLGTGAMVQPYEGTG